MDSDFIPVSQLASLTNRALKTIYNDHAANTGPLAPILTKFGGRLGAWRSDYESWRAQQQRVVRPAA